MNPSLSLIVVALMLLFSIIGSAPLHAQRTGNESVRQIDIAWFATEQYREQLAKRNGDAEQRIEELAAETSRIFERDMNLRLNTVFIGFIAKGQVKTSKNTSATLEAFTDYLQDNGMHYPLSHLIVHHGFTGRTNGAGYMASVCRSRRNAGVSSGNDKLGYLQWTVLHEIGHNLGANHDGTKGCPKMKPARLMAPVPWGGKRYLRGFSECSIKAMNKLLARSPCVVTVMAR